MGYTDPALTDAYFDDEGWYRTEDIGVLDDARLPHHHRPQEGRDHPRRREHQRRRGRGAARPDWTAWPRWRWWPLPTTASANRSVHSCGWLPGADPWTWPQSDAHLDEAGLARQKWPEQLRVIDELPRTPSGKVKKEALRQILRDETS